MFLDNFEHMDTDVSRQDWIARWTNIGDAHSLIGDLNVDNGAFDQAINAWLCALTAFEVARRLFDGGDPQSGEVSAKSAIAIQRVGDLTQRGEPVQIAGYDQSEVPAYYLPAVAAYSVAPALICISSEEETAATLLGRLLPVVIGRGISVLVVSHDDVRGNRRDQSEISLSCCLNWLLARHDVDATRIGVYGEGLSAVLATDFAVFDDRVAAAVCDGGLWDWARTLASVGWLANTAEAPDGSAVPALRSRLVRRLRCPVLVLVGGRGSVSPSEAVKLQADCTAASIDLDLAMPQMDRAHIGGLENFVASDDRVFGWLERKLVHSTAPDPLSARVKTWPTPPRSRLETPTP